MVLEQIEVLHLHKPLLNCCKHLAQPFTSTLLQTRAVAVMSGLSEFTSAYGTDPGAFGSRC
jgi:hypothetical protein